MSLKEISRKVRKNHWLMMIICCASPLILLIIAIYFFGLDNKYLFWGILLLCPIMHYFMMRDMHKKHGDKDREGENKKEGGKIKNIF